MKKQKNTMIMVIVALVVGALGFYGGMMYQKNQTPIGLGQFSGGPGGMNGQNSMMKGRTGSSGMQPIRGEIISSDANSITVKLQDGSSKIVDLTSKTTINKSSQGSKTDLTNGQEVTAFGTKNSDGSINAQIVSIGTGAGMMRGDSQQPQQK